MQCSDATLKVLITDCCYSNFLSAPGYEDGELRGVLNENYNGACVLTALKKLNRAEAKGRRNPELPPKLRKAPVLALTPAPA